MNVLSLFDGISCGQVALNKVGIKYDNYFASEIEEPSIKVTQYNFPNTIQLGDVCKVKAHTLPKIDLLIGGSPCQSFSNSGLQEGFDGKSGLFFEFVRLLKETKPKYFLLENVVMKKEWENIITKHMGVKPVKINSNRLVPQNRPRLYWTNIDFDLDFSDNKTFLKDVLETDVDKKYYLTKEQLSKLDLNFKWSGKDIISYLAGKHQQDRIYRFDSIMGCLVAGTHGSSPHLTKTYMEDGRIRRLTPIEFERLQGLPDDYTKPVTNGNRYKSIGNGWTVDVIAKIFEGLKKEPKTTDVNILNSFFE